MKDTLIINGRTFHLSEENRVKIDFYKSELDKMIEAAGDKENPGCLLDSGKDRFKPFVDEYQKHVLELLEDSEIS